VPLGPTATTGPDVAVIKVVILYICVRYPI
jgi:hypothetical protein